MLAAHEAVDRLRDTLDFARAHIPHYRDPAYDVSITGIEDLARLPIIERPDLVARPASFASSRGWPIGVTWSSNTTGGLGVTRWHSAAELGMLDQVTQTDYGELALVIHPNDMGSALVHPGARNYLYARLLSPWHFDVVHDILSNGWEGPEGRRRVSLFHALNVSLRLFTTWCERRDVDPHDFGVKDLEGYGAPMLTPWRQRVKEEWGAGYQDLYGLSEVKLSLARQCPMCHAYHQTMPIIAEVVDPISRLPISSGVGVLVLTELVPYAELQILMRYWTNDLVEIAEPCLAFGSGFHLVGRLGASALVERTGGAPVVVGAVQVAAACGKYPDIAYDQVPWAPWGTDCGSLRCRVEAQGRRIVVSAALRQSTSLFPARAADLAQAIRDDLLVDVTGLAQAVSEADVELEVHLVGVDDDLHGASLGWGDASFPGPPASV